MAERADEKPGARAGRRDGGDAKPASGTDGAPAGTSGVWNVARVILTCVALVVVVTVVNIFTELDDAHRQGEALPAQIPVILEFTSALGALLSFPVIYAAVRWSGLRRRGWMLLAAVHLAASLGFSALHVALMELFRWAVFGQLGIVHHWSPAEWPYEYRKDLISYTVIAGAFWLLDAPGLRRAAGMTPAPSGGITVGGFDFDIRDGATLLRVPTARILAARAAGNYVEFLLDDGRLPLMRASLREIEAGLAPAGFVRTHRSWLVNEGRIRALAPSGSGDFRLDLDGGVSAPLSRRFPDALKRLRHDERV